MMTQNQAKCAVEVPDRNFYNNTTQFEIAQNEASIHLGGLGDADQYNYWRTIMEEKS